VTGGAAQGWPFLVARGREIGYQLLLAPDFMLAGRESGLLMDEVQGEVPAAGPAKVTTVVGPVSGPVTVVQRTIRATRGDVGLTEQPESPLLDRAGRPILLGYGFVCRGTRLDTVDEQDVSSARSAALGAYRRFYAAEEDFLPEPSHPYPLRSRLAAPVPVPQQRRTASPPRPAPQLPSTQAWTAEVLSTPPTPPPSRPLSRSVLSVVAAVVLVVLAVGIYLVSRPAQESDVAVPMVVGLTQDAAEWQIRDAKLKPVVVDGRVDSHPAGTVIETQPAAGQSLSPGSQVGLVLSIGPVPNRTGQKARSTRP